MSKKNKKHRQSVNELEKAPDSNDAKDETFSFSKEKIEQIVTEVYKKASMSSVSFNVNSTSYEYKRLNDIYNRRLYLYGLIDSPEDYNYLVYGMTASSIVEAIFEINEEDRNVPIKKRAPIILYINSCGGSMVDGFAIISAIAASKTPVYTVNIGQWSSMAFLIGITGDKRYSLPNMTFLLHDGWTGTENSVNKVCDQILFEKHYEKKVVRSHVLKYTKIAKKTYKKIKRKEMYFLPELALKYGVIDEIVDDIDSIL